MNYKLYKGEIVQSAKDQRLPSKIFYLFLAVFVYLFLDKFSTYITDHYFPSSGFNWHTIHHSIQFILVILIMLIPWWNKSLKQWGFNLNHQKETWRILKSFTIGWVIFSTIFILVTQFLSGWPPLIHFYMNFKNTFIYLFFEFIIVGISEEVVFRGLVIGILARSFSQKINLKTFTISVAGILSAVIFAIAHIGFELFPFQITFFDPMQIIIAFGLGIFYAVLFEKTYSLLGPIIAHNIADGWLSILYIVLTLLTR
ncbi:CPBP family intramembrane metalloprotease [candidate division KSB1 bacterium]|nr:CPBP family intramembrane metalloprotease [candidate division KSB1 bacterium]